jgi:hypothetical protein
VGFESESLEFSASRVEGSGFGVWDVGVRVQGSGFRVEFF